MIGRFYGRFLSTARRYDSCHCMPGVDSKWRVFAARIWAVIVCLAIYTVPTVYIAITGSRTFDQPSGRTVEMSIKLPAWGAGHALDSFPDAMRYTTPLLFAIHQTITYADIGIGLALIVLAPVWARFLPDGLMK